MEFYGIRRANINIPKSVFRYRSLASEGLFEREFDAIKNSYLYGASFKHMNDPMEAFYEFGSSNDRFLDKTLSDLNFKSANLYKLFADIIDKWGLISFATCPNNILMWAHYASSFSGLCLEFDTSKLIEGGFKQDTLRGVTYSNDPLPSIALNSVMAKGNEFQKAMEDRLSRKRLEWAYEDEWRFILGETGRRYYFDNALIRVYLGPRINIEYKAKLKKFFKRRQVDVIEGGIEGFELKFKLDQVASLSSKIDRISSGFGSLRIIENEKESIGKFLDVPFDALLTLCKKMAKHPNFDDFIDVGISEKFNGSIFLWIGYKLRD